MSVLLSRPSSHVEAPRSASATPYPAAEHEDEVDKLKKAWTWLKENWKWLLFPVGITIFILGRISSSRGDGGLVDPTAGADARAREERERRESELEAERARLEARLAAVHQEHQEKLQTLTEQQQERVAELQQDPEALNAWLRSL